MVFIGAPRRRLALADQKIPLNLTPGTNRLLFKIGNFAGNMMVAHVVDKDGDRLPGIEFLLPGKQIPTAVEEVATDGILPVAAELELLTPGYHHVTWDGRDAAGHSAAGGIYYTVLDVEGMRQSKPMALIR